MLSKTQKKLRITSIIVSAIAFGFILLNVMPTFSWFGTDSNSNIKIDGNVHGSYFEGGDGSVENPYQIAHPIQLYYLAWLQEMGYFNEIQYAKDNDGNVTTTPATDSDGNYLINQQYHFILTNDIDMLVPGEGDNNTDLQYILPPIGTVKYPFVGSFDGKGHKISHLVVKNNVDGQDGIYTKDPYTARNSNTAAQEYEILGMFGVIGSTQSNPDSAFVNVSQLDAQGSMTVVGTPAKFEKYDEETSQPLNYVQNFYINDITLASAYVSSHKTLVGAVAGYANAPVKNVGVKSVSMSYATGSNSAHLSGDVSQYNSETPLIGVDQNVLSKYGTLGYVTGDYERVVNLESESIYEPKASAKTYVASSSGTAWGGSIDMANLLRRIYNSRLISGTLQDTVPAYPIVETHYYNSNNELTKTTTTYNNEAYNKLSNKDKTCYYLSDSIHSNISGFEYSDVVGNENYSNTIGSYYFIDQKTGNPGDLKAYVGGYSDCPGSTTKDVYEVHQGSQNETAYYVKSGSGDNTYIGCGDSGNVLTNCATNSNYVVKWHYNSTQKSLRGVVKTSYTTNYSGSNPQNQYHDRIMYLNYSSSGFTFDEESSTSWDINSSTGVFSVSTPSGYRIKNSSNNNWLSVNDSFNGFKNVTSQSDATIWNIQNFTSSSSGTISCTKNGVTKYICRSGNSSTTLSLEETNYSSNRTLYRSGTGSNTGNNSTYLCFQNSRNWYYINLNNTTWRISTKTNTSAPSANLTITYVAGSTNSFNSSSTNDTLPTISTPTTERSGQAGYIPLTANGDKNEGTFKYTGGTSKVSDFYTSSMNTGYIVGGHYDWYNGQNTTTISTTNYGDVRVAQYSRDYINTSYSWGNNGDFTKLYTINDDCSNTSGSNPIQININGEECDNTGAALANGRSYSFKKLSSATTKLRTSLINVYKNNEKLSGIHYMNSRISMDKLITADKVLVNSETYTNYEMPEDSIDFNLLEKGYINFFAGNYHNDNNGFFALHKIERDENNKIISVNKIKYIFENSSDSLADNIYYLIDDDGVGHWSDGASTSTRNAETIRTSQNKTFTANGSTYKFVFDTGWIGYNDYLVPHVGQGNTRGDQHKRLYYFEIPVNSGEYALGSFEGPSQNKIGCGAYLVYLDISAASQTVNRKTLSECFTISELAKSIPYGTQFVSSIPTAVPVLDENNNPIVNAIVRTDIQNINDLDSYYGTISNNADGSYTISRENNVITKTGDSALSTYFIGYNLTPQGADPPITKTRRRITDFDYNTITNQYVIQTTIVDTTELTVDSVTVSYNTATTTIGYNSTGFNDEMTPVTTFTYSWYGEGPQFNYSYYLHASDGNDNGIAISFNNVACEDFDITVLELASNFTFSSGIDSITNDDLTGSPVKNTIAVAKSNIIASDVVSDSWEEFVFETSIATVRYLTQGSGQAKENITEVITLTNYVLSDPEDGFEEEEVSIDIVAPQDPETHQNTSELTYTIEFLLSNSSSIPADETTWFYVWYTKDETTYLVVISSNSNSEPINYVNQSA